MTLKKFNYPLSSRSFLKLFPSFFRYSRIMINLCSTYCVNCCNLIFTCDKMKLIVKKLQGGECTIEVQPSTLISEVKEKVSVQLSIPVRQQTLLSLGRTLLDEQDVQSYPSIKDGSKLTLVIKKPDSLYDIAFKAFKKAGMTDTEAKCTTNKFLDTIQENFNKLSWDDIDTLALDCMEEGTVKATS